MIPSRALAAAIVPLVLSVASFSSGAPPTKTVGAWTAATPEGVGLSSERLRRIGAAMKREVDAGKVAGVVTLVARSGRMAQLEAAGMADVEGRVPMSTDTIFRIASMSKAITSVAVMMLVEEGRLSLGDPVSTYIPSFARTSVMVRPPPDAPAGTPIGMIPVKRAITIRDLLTHTAGISYGEGPAEAQYKAAGLLSWYFADKPEPIAQLIDRLPALPFDAQPGEKFVYGFNSDVLGVVVEKVSGQTLDEFFRTRIFTPLRMPDTHFFLPPEKSPRLATVYSAKDGRIERAPDPGRVGQGEYVTGPRACFSGGAGLLSTASDYARFLQMLLNGGELDGVRLLSPKTVELMTANHVGGLYNEGRTGFGLGFEVVEHAGRAGRYGSIGEFAWGGAYHTACFVDPQEQVVAVFLSQLLPSGGLGLTGRFRTLVYQAIVAPAKIPDSRLSRTKPTTLK